MIPKAFLLFFLLLLSFATWSRGTGPEMATDTLVLTLEQAQEEAVRHSRDIMLAGIEVEKAHAQVREAMSSLLPQVNGYVSYKQYGQLPSTIFPNTQQQVMNDVYIAIEEGFEGTGAPLEDPISQDPASIPDAAVLQFGEKYNINAEVSASQVVFNAVFMVGLKAASSYVSMVEYRQDLTEESVRDNVRRSYYAVLAAREQIETLERNITNLTELREQTRALFENGFAEAIDVDRLQLSLNNLDNQLLQAKRQVELARSVLKFQMGMEVHTPVRILGSLEEFIGGMDYELPIRGDFSSRSELALFDVREEVNQYNIKRYRAGYYPNLYAFAALGTSAQRKTFDFFRFGSEQTWLNQRFFGLQLDVPIWDSFGNKARVQGAILDLDKVRLERERLQLGMDLEYEKAKTGFINAGEQLDHARENIALAERIYHVSQVKYQEGVGSSIEMTNAERDLYQAQANYILAAYDLLVARADVDKALGLND